MGESRYSPTLPPHFVAIVGEMGRTQAGLHGNISLEFLGFLRVLASPYGKGGGGQGLYRTFHLAN